MIYITPREVADLLQISYENALNLIKYSGVKHVKIGRQYRVDKTTLLTFLQKQGTYGIRISP